MTMDEYDERIKAIVGKIVVDEFDMNLSNRLYDMTPPTRPIEIIDGFVNDPDSPPPSDKPEYANRRHLLSGDPLLDIRRVIDRMRNMVRIGTYDRNEVARWIDGLEDISATMRLTKRQRRRLIALRARSGT